MTNYCEITIKNNFEIIMKKAVLLEKISGENYFKFEDFHLIKFLIRLVLMGPRYHQSFVECPSHNEFQFLHRFLNPELHQLILS